jgi:hypothetical protein
MQAGVRVKIRTITVIILSAFLVSIILIVAFPHKSRALLPEVIQETASLLQQTTAPIVTTVTPSASPIQTVAPTVSPDKSSTASKVPVASQQSASPAVSSSSPSSSTSTPDGSKPLISAELQTINFSKATKKSFGNSTQGTSLAGSAGEARSFMWVQATADGWKFMGVLWYWWLLLGTYIAIGFMAWKGNAGWYLMRLWLSLQHRIYAR